MLRVKSDRFIASGSAFVEFIPDRTSHFNRFGLFKLKERHPAIVSGLKSRRGAGFRALLPNYARILTPTHLGLSKASRIKA